MTDRIKNLVQNKGELYQFIMFNLLSNIATITNFIVMNISKEFIFRDLSNTDFKFFIFDYSVKNGGLSGFLAFLLSFFVAQSVNFIIQSKYVFHKAGNIKKSLSIYFAVTIVVYLICLYIPTVTIPLLSIYFTHNISMNITNIINIMIQVIIMYPVMKYVIMK